jgi:hypothetical protein
MKKDIPKKIRKELRKYILLSLAWLCYVLVFGQGYSYSFDTAKVYLIFFLAIPFQVYLLGVIISGKIMRAFIIQLFISLLAIICNIIMLFLMYSYQLFTSSINHAGLILFIHIIFLTIIIFFSVRGEEESFIEAEILNIKSGKLDVKNMIWDLSVPIVWDNPRAEERRITVYKRVKRFSILLPGIAFWIGRQVDFTSGSLAQMVILFFTYLLAYGSGRQINLLFQIRRWEKRYGAPLNLK